jgi:hypothetical protein
MIVLLVKLVKFCVKIVQNHNLHHDLLLYDNFAIAITMTKTILPEMLLVFQVKNRQRN